MQARLLRNILLTIALFALTVPAFFCNTPSAKQEEEEEAHEPSLWRNVYDTSAHYVGMETCRGCHQGVYDTYMQTGMGKSFGVATKEKSAADFTPDHALVYDSALDYYYKPYWENNAYYIMEFRLEAGDTIHKRIQKVDFIVGSGQHTNSHLFSTNGYLFQAPITFYTQKQKWDMAPGFEKGSSTRFSRLIQIECMSCHNGYPEFVRNSENKFTSLKMGIDCERCHGPGSLHVQERQNSVPVDTSKGPDYSIVNPRRLPVELQNNVCQRCHLQGIAVLNDGKTFFDFRPGMKLSQVANVFMPEYEGAQDKMIMASHVERMKKSNCFMKSGKMSCITCHNPHISVKFTPRSQYLNACQSCHSTPPQKQCSETAKNKALKNNDCVTCHMPHNSSIDIPHVAVTDHYIRRQPQNDTLAKKITAFLGMKCYNNPQPDDITTARGFMEFYERYAQSKGLLDSTLLYLGRAANIEAAKKQNRDYIRVYFLMHDYEKVISYAAPLKPAAIKDGLNNSQQSFHICAICCSHFPIRSLHFQLSTNCRQFKSIVTFYPDLHPEPIITRVDAFAQHGNDIDNREVPGFSSLIEVTTNWRIFKSNERLFFCHDPPPSDTVLNSNPIHQVHALLKQTVLLISSPIISFIVSVNLVSCTTSYTTAFATSAVSSCFALNSGTLMIMRNTLTDSLPSTYFAARMSIINEST